MTVKKYPLEPWIASKIGVHEGELTQELIRKYQLEKLRATIQHAKSLSPFYHNLFKRLATTEISCLADLQRIPFTTAGDLRKQAMQFLCVSQDDISRVVTLQSSGTTGDAKRLFFTPADQELTIDFFQQGMSILVEAGDRVLILLPGERPGSVGDLLATALNRSGVKPVPYGVVGDIPETLEIMAREKIDALVGIPSQVLALARYADLVAKRNFRLKSVLLSTDYVPRSVVAELSRLWGCEVFEHYGMTEMGFGGGIDCSTHNGYHLREADLYCEIVDPVTGQPLPDGQMGEVVVTTLTRQGMPLIRYRTGDISCIMPEPCCCGTMLRRLARVVRRNNGRIFLSYNQHFTLSELDENLFKVESLINFTASVDDTCQAKKLKLSAVTIGVSDMATRREIYKALDAVPAIYWGRRNAKLTVDVKTARYTDTIASGTAKRVIAELNEADGN